MQYKIVAILWQDHMSVNRGTLPVNMEDIFLKPTLTIGAIIKKTPKMLVVLSDLERYADRDEGTYMIILRPNIVSIKEYGKIEIENIRFAP